MYDIATRPYCHASILNEQIVRERGSLWKEGMKYHLMLFLTLVFCSLLCVWARTEVVQVGYEISRATMAYQEQVKENQRLRVEVVSLRSPSRIETIAASRLGLSYPKQDQILFIP
ncbi:MAG TPA: cell division protein FtsL [Thermodesulfobacteriota bacterium]|nr:cell division protein FtsL [Deltaproteobacteria bacterium]HNR14887.1 cell division protein FtsL [Thermodesulfobacteriota bacterium]HNU71573.1 cell division protein FtsL [Thermodesulfobacteriota bacterium]HQO77504.1 cell division protein FtsL [Thermodesulfobacteriota bacterium]